MDCFPKTDSVGSFILLTDHYDARLQRLDKSSFSFKNYTDVDVKHSLPISTAECRRLRCSLEFFPLLVESETRTAATHLPVRS